MNLKKAGLVLSAVLLSAGLSLAGENCDWKHKDKNSKVGANEIKVPGKKSNAANYKQIAHDDFVKAVEAKNIVLIDANGSESWKQGHIPGAIDFGMGIKNLMAKLPEDKNAQIVAYCGGPGCEAWCKAADELDKAGYKNIRYYKGGLKGWKTAGMELATPEKASKAG